MFKKILVPVDGSAKASQAVGYAIELASRFEAEILLLHVIRNFALPKALLDMITAGEVTESRRELLEDSAEIILSEARQQCTESGISSVFTEYIVGDPATSIVAYAEQHNVDLIVIGNRGLASDAPHNLLGDVARKLTNIASLPILIVR